MSSLIHVLDEGTANKIAAGEVVERPSSCIKELIENAVDAGATAIETEIADGGRSYMRVSDNGCGMSAEDAEKCLIRHGTSKIRSVEDIFAITSLGFRGEAVPSIAAVSRMTLTTRQRDAVLATQLLIDGGVIKEKEETGAPVGTTVEVAELFFNTPARRKFLKSERTESAKISEIVTKLALANSGIEFTLITNGRTTLHTGGQGDLKETIAGIYGAAAAREIFPVTYEGETLTISGFVGKPSLLKSSRAWQTSIVNRRVVQNGIIYKAIENAYHAMLPKAGYPLAVLQIDIDPAFIDVNVHPAKTEIKFADEKEVYRAVYHSIVTALVSQDRPETIAASAPLPPRQRERLEPLRDIASPQESELPFTASAQPSVPATTYAAPAVSAQQHVGESPRRPYEPVLTPDDVPAAAAAAFTAALAAESKVPGTEEEQGPVITFDGDADVFIPLGEVADCYIVAKKGEDLYLIDHHAAHERVRYDTFCKRTEALPSQQLLTAEFVEVDSHDMALLTERQDVFVDLGYAYSVAGPSTLRMEAVPCDLQTPHIADSLREICRILTLQPSLDKAMLRHTSLAYLSCHGAIKAGDKLNIREMKQLLEALFQTEKPFVCPHGRPIIVRFTPADLARLFKRT